MNRCVADVGNSRLKVGVLGSDGALIAARSLPLDDVSAWRTALRAMGTFEGPTHWAISSVNPPLTARLIEVVQEGPHTTYRVFTSAEGVPMAHRLAAPGRTGADRALAVWEAWRRHGRPGAAGQVVACGTALTVEYISSDGTWVGGAIAPGLATAAVALNRLTAQLPLVRPGGPPAAWGDSTEPAILAGAFWGCVGSARELLERQARALGAASWRVWTGGDARTIAEAVDGPEARVEPDLVLHALARLLSSETQAGPP